MSFQNYNLIEGFKSLYYAERIGSTQDEMKKAYAKGPMLDSTALLASYQTSGHGREGRAWQGLPFPQIYCSFFKTIHLSEQFLASLPSLSLIVGLSLLKTLEKEFNLPLKLKWPNDLLYKDKKMAGLLIDVLKNKSGSIDLLIGFGINLSANPMDFSDALKDKAIALGQEVLSQEKRIALTAQMLTQLIKDIELFCDHGFSFFKNAYLQKFALMNQYVEMALPHGAEKLYVTGVSDYGELLALKADQSPLNILSGHILRIY